MTLGGKNLEILNWNFYKTNGLPNNNPNSPFETCELSGYYYTYKSAEAQKHSLQPDQVMLYDGWLDSFHGAKLDLTVKEHYKARISIEGYKDYIERMFENLKDCLNPESTVLEAEKRALYTINQECVEFTLSGGDRFELDIFAAFKSQHHGGRACTLRVSKNGKTYEYSVDDAANCTFTITLLEASFLQDETAEAVLQTNVLPVDDPLFSGSMHPSVRIDVCEKARSYLNDPFVWGGNTPINDGGTGTDSSGFVLHVLNAVFSDLNLPDMTTAGIVKTFDETNAPMPGDLAVFTKPDGSYRGLDFYVGNNESIGTMSPSRCLNGEESGVKVRTFNSSREPAYYLSINSVCLNELTKPSNRLMSIPDYESGAEGNPAYIKRVIVGIQNYLRSLGLYNGLLDGKVTVNFRNGVKALQQLLRPLVGESRYDQYIDGRFCDKMLHDVQKFEFDQTNKSNLTFRSLVENYLASDTIDPYNPFAFFVHTSVHDPSIWSANQEELKIDLNQGMHLKIRHGWSAKMRLTASYNYFQENVPMHAEHPDVGDCYNKPNTSWWPFSSEPSIIEFELSGGDELCIRPGQWITYPKDSGQYTRTNSVFFLTLRRGIVSKRNISQAPSEPFILQLVDFKAPNADWCHYGVLPPHNWNRNYQSDDNFLTQLKQELDLEGMVSSLDSAGDEVEFAVEVNAALELKVLTKALFKVTRIDGGKYQLDSSWLLGAGIELGSTKVGWGHNSSSKFSAKAGYEAGASVSGTWESTYLYNSVHEVNRDLPAAILSVVSLYMPSFASLYRTIVGVDYSKPKHSDKFTLSSDLAASAEFNIGLQGFNLASIGAGASLSGGRRIIVDVVHKPSGSKEVTLGMEFELAGGVNAGASLNLSGKPPHEMTDIEIAQARGLEVVDEGPLDNKLSLSKLNLSGAVKVEIELLKTSWGTVSTPASDILKSEDKNGRLSLTAVQQNLNLNTNAISGLSHNVKITTQVVKQSKTAEVVIEFTCSMPIAMTLIGTMVGSSPLGTFAALWSLSGNLSSQITNLSMQIYSLNTSGKGVGGSVRIAGVGFDISTGISKVDRTPVFASAYTTSGTISEQALKMYNVMDNKLKMMLLGWN